MKQTIKKIRGYTIFMNKIIGEGASGKVFQCIRLKDNQPCAVKVLSKKLLQQYGLKECLIKEVQILKNVQSNNIVRVLDTLESGNNYYIIQELCQQDLERYMKRNKNISQDQAINILKQIVAGFIVLVQQGVIHRDLKPANILIQKNIIKIADFGVAKNNVTQKMKNQSLIGTPLYMAPQLLNLNSYTSKCDVWSCGLIFYQLLHSKPPWNAKSRGQIRNKLQQQPLSIQRKLRPQTIDFLQQTLQLSEDTRLSWEEVFQHRIFKGQFGYLKENKAIIEGKLKLLMKCLRQQIYTKNIDVYELFKEKGFHEKLNFQDFCIFVDSMCPNINKNQLRVIYDLLDTDSSGVIQFSQIEASMSSNLIDLNRSDMRKTTSIYPKTGDPQTLKQRFFKRLYEKLENLNLPFSELFESISLTKNLSYTNFRSLFSNFLEFNEKDLEIVFKSIDFDKINQIPLQDFKLIYSQINELRFQDID